MIDVGLQVGPRSKVNTRVLSAMLPDESEHTETICLYDDLGVDKFVGTLAKKYRKPLSEFEGLKEHIIQRGEIVDCVANGKQIDKFQFSELKEQNPKLHAPVVDGIAREAETVNIVSVSKVGKSWLVYYLLLTIIFGQKLFGRFQCTAGRVLLVDNELHKPTIVDRVLKVAEAMGVFCADFEHLLDVWPLRANLKTISDIEAELDKEPSGKYRSIVFDARYRFAIDGESENDNAQQALFYNQLDRIAVKTGATLFLVHHSTKGSQSDKRVTDVGAGAGSQSRAADAHVVLREHSEEAHVVLEAAVRSFAPVEPMTLKWEFPLWTPVDLDPTDLRGSKTKQAEQQERNDDEGMRQITSALMDGPATASKVRESTGLSRDRANRLMNKMVSDGHLEAKAVKIRGNSTKEYRLIQDD